MNLCSLYVASPSGPGHMAVKSSRVREYVEYYYNMMYLHTCGFRFNSGVFKDWCWMQHWYFGVSGT